MASEMSRMISKASEKLERDLVGNQVPHHILLNDGSDEQGDKAIKLAKRITVPPMPWQEMCVKAILKVDEYGRWVHSDSCLIVPRQNGKSWIMVILIIYKLFVLRENILLTAQQWKTAEDIFKRAWSIVEARKSLKSKVARFTCSQGRGTIELAKLSGEDVAPQVVFTTRSADAGRGLTKIDTLICDEAYNLTDAELAALAFIQMAADDPQTIYTSSAVNAEQHPYGEVLTSLRERGLAGEDPKFFFAEWMAPESMDRLAETTWIYANPSYGIIQTKEKMEKMLKGMQTAAGKKSFDVEALGRGDWPLLEDDEITPIILPESWQKREDQDPQIIGDSAVAVDVSPLGERVAIVAASRTSGGGVHLSLHPHEEFKREAVVKTLVAAADREDPVSFTLDPIGSSAVLESALKPHNICTDNMSLKRVMASFELFLQLFDEGKITHDGNPRWLEALSHAEIREIQQGAGRALTTKSGDITPLAAAFFAVWALTEFEIPRVAPARAKGRKKNVGAAVPVKRKPAMAGAF